ERLSRHARAGLQIEAQDSPASRWAMDDEARAGTCPAPDDRAMGFKPVPAASEEDLIRWPRPAETRLRQALQARSRPLRRSFSLAESRGCVPREVVAPGHAEEAKVHHARIPGKHAATAGGLQAKQLQRGLVQRELARHDGPAGDPGASNQVAMPSANLQLEGSVV